MFLSGRQYLHFTINLHSTCLFVSYYVINLSKHEHFHVMSGGLYVFVVLPASTCWWRDFWWLTCLLIISYNVDDIFINDML